MGRPGGYSASFKAKVALEALKEQESLQSLAKRFDVSPQKINKWREAFVTNATQTFKKPSEDKRALRQLKNEHQRLLCKVGQLTLECDFLRQPARRVVSKFVDRAGEPSPRRHHEKALL